jgi:hypothetical protein
VAELQKAVELLEDNNLVWSEDFDTIRLDLSKLFRKAASDRYHNLEAELDTLAKQITNEGSNNARGTNS